MNLISASLRPRDSAKRIAIVGLPNSGKSRLSNSLTGAYEVVSNYPLTTVEIKRNRCVVEGQPWEILDTPGLHGIYIQSEEELAVRDMLYTDPPDVLVQCVDAHRLKESLLLTSDLLDLGLPLLLVVTAVGESARRGLRINASALSRLLGVPVVLSSEPGKGIAELRRVLRSPPAPPRVAPFNDALETAIARAERVLPDSLPFLRTSALLLLENDPSFRDFFERRTERIRGDTAAQRIRGDTAAQRIRGDTAAQRIRGDTAARGTPADGVERELEEIRSSLAGKVALIVNARRSQWVDEIAAATTEGATAAAAGFSETFARLCRHPLYGLPILAFFLVLLYLFVVYGAGALSLLLTTSITDPVVAVVRRFLPEGFWRDLLVGQHGILTLGLFNSLTTVLPILSVFFMAFGIFEDIGYLPNLAILTRRILQKIGITGNSVIPLVLGFGCKTMATMTARTLQSRKERIIVVALIAFAIPCSAQMGLAIAILGAHGVRSFVTAFAFLAAAEIAAGLILGKLLPEDKPGQFLQELPPIRAPRIAAVARKTGHRLLWFLREAIPIFLIAAVAMFAIDKLGVLGLLKQALKPVMTGWLGLPLDMVDALLLTLARSEAAAGLILRMSQEGVLNGAQSVIAVLLLVTFAQCFANIAAMFKEVGARVAIIMVIAVYLMSFLYTGAVHGVLTLTAGVLRL
jgi:ferrous iron transport protein B